jgi:TRAP-type C4-dicarboxylate transport system permease small subunit
VAKRRSNQPTLEEKHVAQAKRRKLLLQVVWLVIVIIAALFGYSQASPLLAQGQVMWGIIMGLAYGLGALALIMAAFYLNRKMKGY